MRIFISLYISFFILSFMNGQVSVHEEYDNINPIKKNTTISQEEKIKIYENFLDNALKTANQKNTFFGYLFLLSDKMRNQDYVSANVFLIKADSIALLTKNKKWIGHMMHRKAILSSRLKDDDTAFKWYLESVSVCGEGKDSLCVAEAYEQIGYLYGIKNDIDKSNDYYLLNSSRKCNFS